MSVKTAGARDRIRFLYDLHRESARVPAWLQPERDLAIARFSEIGFPFPYREIQAYLTVCAGGSMSCRC